jgi:hypothetical protein
MVLRSRKRKVKLLKKTGIIDTEVETHMEASSDSCDSAIRQGNLHFEVGYTLQSELS